MSATARLVRLGVALEDAGGHADGLPLATRQLARRGTRGRIGLAPARWALRLAQALTLPHLSRHFVARKRQLRVWCDAALRADARRVVILGAGADGLGPELAQRHRQLEVIEVDAPAAAHWRRTQLHALDMEAPNLRLLARDLRQRRALADLCSSSRPTVWVAEGVLMYLPLSSVMRLLQAVSASPAWQRLIFSTATPRADGRLAFAGARPWCSWYLAAHGEPWQWAAAPERTIEALSAAGYPVRALAGAGTLRHPQPPIPAQPLPCPGECLFLAQRRAPSVARV